MLRDLDSFLPLVVWVVGDVLDQSVDQCVLVQGLRADHHVSLAVPVLTGHRVSDLLLVWSDLHVRTWHRFALPEKIGKNLAEKMTISLPWRHCFLLWRWCSGSR